MRPSIFDPRRWRESYANAAEGWPSFWFTPADPLLLSVRDGEAALREVLARGLAPVGSLVRRSTLEDVFLTLTGRTLVDG